MKNFFSLLLFLFVFVNLYSQDKVKGKVVVIADYGAFVEIDEGIEGLVHVSEMSWSTHLRSAQDFVNVGDEIEITGKAFVKKQFISLQ